MRLSCLIPVPYSFEIRQAMPLLLRALPYNKAFSAEVQPAGDLMSGEMLPQPACFIRILISQPKVYFFEENLYLTSCKLIKIL